MPKKERLVQVLIENEFNRNQPVPPKFDVDWLERQFILSIDFSQKNLKKAQYEMKLIRELEKEYRADKKAFVLKYYKKFKKNWEQKAKKNPFLYNDLIKALESI